MRQEIEIAFKRLQSFLGKHKSTNEYFSQVLDNQSKHSSTLN